MKVIARIPALSRSEIADDAWAPAVDPAVPGAATRSASRTPPDVAAAAAVEGPEDEKPRASRGRASTRHRVNPVASPSVLVLAAIAAAVWAAAWRSDRLRAIEQQRLHRVAMEPAASAGPERSITP